MNWLLSETGLSILSGISLLIFAGFFAGMLVWVFRLNKGYVREMAMLPLGFPVEDRIDKENGNE